MDRIIKGLTIAFFVGLFACWCYLANVSADNKFAEQQSREAINKRNAAIVDSLRWRKKFNLN